MECDVAVLGGGPAGYTAAIRAAQLGAKTVCVEREPELGGTCLRVGCIPTKAWVQTAHAMHAAHETFAKLGVRVGEPQLDFGAANEWKAAVSKQMTGGVAFLFKAFGVEWVRGTGRFTDANTIAVEGGGGRHLPQRDRRHRLVPDPTADPGPRLLALRRFDGAARPDGSPAPPRRARRRDHRVRVRLDLPAVRLRGRRDRDARHVDSDGRCGRGEGAGEGFRQAGDRAPSRQAVHSRSTITVLTWQSTSATARRSSAT